MQYRAHAKTNPSRIRVLAVPSGTFELVRDLRVTGRSGAQSYRLTLLGRQAVGRGAHRLCLFVARAVSSGHGSLSGTRCSGPPSSAARRLDRWMACLRRSSFRIRRCASRNAGAETTALGSNDGAAPDSQKKVSCTISSAARRAASRLSTPGTPAARGRTARQAPRVDQPPGPSQVLVQAPAGAGVAARPIVIACRLVEPRSSAHSGGMVPTTRC